MRTLAPRERMRPLARSEPRGCRAGFAIVRAGVVRVRDGLLVATGQLPGVDSGKGV